MTTAVAATSSTRDFAFDPHFLQALAADRNAAYRSAAPFPHIAIDDFLPLHTIEVLAAEFPGPDSDIWFRAEKTWESKRSCEIETRFPPTIKQVLREFNSSAFISFLEALTGIDGLIPDPHYRGGGLHSISRGGNLGVHADFNYYERLKLHRRLNVLLYLNDEWPSEFGGNLELWDDRMTHCVRAYSPQYNRCVIFSTTDDSYHGHPDPLNCPKHRTRNSLALYYYTADRPDAERSTPHSTLFQQRPDSSDKVPDLSNNLLKRIVRRLLR